MSEPAPDNPMNSRLTKPEWRWIWLAAAGAFALRTIFAEAHGFWVDELYTLNAALMSPWDLVAERLQAGHSPLPFLYAKIFLELLGDSERMLRLSAAIPSALTVVGLGMLTVALGLRRALAPVLVLAVFQPYWQAIGTEFRYTMPLVCLGTFAALTLLWWLREGQRWQGLACTALFGIALCWHGSAQFIGLAMTGFVVWRWWMLERDGVDRWRRLGRGLMPILSGVMVSVPLLLLISHLQRPDQVAESEFPSIRTALMNQVNTLFGSEQLPASITGLGGDAVGILGVLIYLGALIPLLRRSWRQGNRELVAFLVAVLAGLPLLIMIFTTFKSGVQGPERYVAFGSIPLTLAVGAGWVESLQWPAVWRWIWRTLLVGLFSLCSMLSILNQGDWHREACKWIVENRRVEEPFLFMGMGMNEVALRHYGLEWEGVVYGVPANKRETWGLEWEIRVARDFYAPNADALWVLLYRHGRLQLEPMLENLAKPEVFGYRRAEIRAFTADVTILGFAFTEAGEERLELLRKAPGPWLTDSPLRR